MPGTSTGADHFTYLVTDDWRTEAPYTADLTRVQRPSRVTFRIKRWLGKAELGIREDRAH